MLSTPTCGLALFHGIHVPHFTLEHRKNQKSKNCHIIVFSNFFVNTPNTQAFDEHQIQGNLGVLETHPINTLFFIHSKRRAVIREKCHARNAMSSFSTHEAVQRGIPILFNAKALCNTALSNTWVWRRDVSRLKLSC